MEPVTHFLTGECIGRAGFNRRTAYATLAATLAAEAPDIDVLWGLGGPIVSFQHHRGITHTFIAAPFVALATTCLIWLLDRFFAPRVGMFLLFTFGVVILKRACPSDRDLDQKLERCCFRIRNGWFQLTNQRRLVQYNALPEQQLTSLN